MSQDPILEIIPRSQCITSLTNIFKIDAKEKEIGLVIIPNHKPLH